MEKDFVSPEKLEQKQSFSASPWPPPNPHSNTTGDMSSELLVPLCVLILALSPT